MDNNIKQRWVAALRSGQYQQTEGTLNGGDNQYCCLGVLCSLYMQETKRAVWKEVSEGLRFAETEWDETEFHDTNVLPEPVRQWAGISEVDPIFRLPKDSKVQDKDTLRLAHLNDAGVDFERIADRIEYGIEQVK